MDWNEAGKIAAALLAHECNVCSEEIAADDVRFCLACRRRVCVDCGVGSLQAFTCDHCRVIP